MNRISLSLILTIAALGASRIVRAGEGCCTHCGCHECHKVCRLVCEEKKVEVVCWGCKCENFCLPTHGKEIAKHCELVCDDQACGDCHNGVQVKPKKFVWREWCPSCAKMFTKKKLMKKVITKKIPTYKWVVEDVCDKCDAQCPGAALPPDGEIPAPPLANVELRYRRAPAAEVVIAPR